MECRAQILFLFIMNSLLSKLFLVHFTNSGGVRMLLTDRNKLIMTVGGATALAAGVYTTRFLFCSMHFQLDS